MFVLSNRNVLYTHLSDDAEFYAAATITGDTVAVASRAGYIYSVDTATREIKLVSDVEREITCIAYDKPRSLLWIGGEHGCLGYSPTTSKLTCRAISSNFEDEHLIYRSAETEIYSEILAISAHSNLNIIDATGHIHTLSNINLLDGEPPHSPTLRQVNGCIKGLRLISGDNSLGARFFSWTGHRVCFYDNVQCVKSIDLEDEGNECPEIDVAAFSPERGLLIIGDNFRTLRYFQIPFGRY